jgi:hypothetical protein
MKMGKWENREYRNSWPRGTRLAKKNKAGYHMLESIE